MTEHDAQIAIESPDDAIGRAIAAILDDARAGPPIEPSAWSALEHRFAWCQLPEMVGPLLRQALALADAAEADTALALLEADSPDDQNVEIPLMAAAIARAAGSMPEAWHELARERFVGLFQSSRLLVDKGHPQQALSILLRQAPLVHFLFSGRVERPLAMARFLSLMGSALDDMSHFRLSERAYSASLELLEADEDEFRAERAKTLSNLGALHQLDGQFDKSSHLLDRAVIAFEALPSSEEATYGLAAALINRGHSANYRGRPTDAEADWRRALGLAARASDYHDAIAAEAAIHLAGQQLDREEWSAALETVRQGWQAALRAGDKARRGEIVALAAQGALRAHQDERAVRLYASARRRFERLAPDHLADRLDAMRGEAQALAYCHATADAMTMARQALTEGVAALGEPHEQNLRTKALLADLCWDTDAFGEGETWAAAARDDARAMFAPDHPNNLMRESRLAEFLLVDGRGGDAIAILLDCLAREPLLTDRLIDGRSDLTDLSAMRTAKSQLDLATLAVLRTEPLDTSAVMRLTDIRLRFGGSGVALLAARRNGRSLPENLAPALLAAGEAESRPLIAATTLFHEKGVMRRALALWCAAACTLHDLGPAAALDEALARWSQAPWRPVGEAAGPLLGLLHERAGSTQRLLWFPDAALAPIPIAALFSSAHPLLLERFAIVQSRDAYAAFGAAFPTTNKALLVGVSEFLADDGSVLERPLPAVRDEIARLAAIYRDAKELVDGDATIFRLATALESRPSVVHIATHGLSAANADGPSRIRRALHRILPDEPLQRSAILMSGADDVDRLLTARRLAAWDLSSVRLLVLAACDSAVGLNDAAEGSLGFQAALHLAGVATIVSSLWPIGDAESARLMAEFHEGLVAGKAPSAALRAAQLSASRRGENPSAWGGFVVSGADDPLATGMLGDGARHD